MRSLKVIFLLVCQVTFCYACLVNGNVSFKSRNFNNVLRWDPAKPEFPGQKVLYSVQYKIYPGSYQIKEECHNITELYCDLTAETPSDHDVQYIGKVLANGRCHGRTNFFKPRAETVLGAPTLFVNLTRSSLHINVTLPLGPNRVSIAEIFKISKKGPSETLILYHLKITHPLWAVQDLENTTGQFVVSLRNNQEFCGYVVYEPAFEWGRSSSEAEYFCVTAPSDPWMFLPWPLLGAALLGTIVMISVWCACSYVKGGKRNSMPQSLETTFSYPIKILQPPDGNLSISKIGFSAQSEQTVYATVQVKPDVPSVMDGAYPHKNTLFQPWQGSGSSSVETRVHSPTPKIQDSSSEWSEIYSAVAVHVPPEENEDVQLAGTDDRERSNTTLLSHEESWDKGGTSPKLASLGVPPLTDSDACESNQAMPLLLQTVRDSNGQLTLPMFTFQIQNSVGGTAPLPNPEKKPLLSDLIVSKGETPTFISLQSLDSSEWSDSGCDEGTVNSPTHAYCNSHYSPTQPPSTSSSESAYKKNWMPKILHGISHPTDSGDYGKMNSPWTWSGLKERDEGEEDELRRGEGESRQILLGGWMVQIQE